LNENQTEIEITDHIKGLIDYENFEENLHINEKKTLEEKVKKLERKMKQYQKETVLNL
jgi:hypothetical protein